MVGIEGLVFKLLVLLLPVNLARHFFFDFAYVDGILVDYLIPTVYLTDILIWGLLGFWAFRAFRDFRGFSVRNSFVLCLGFLLVASFSVFRAVNQPAAVYKWLKLLEYVLFALYVSKHVDLKKDWARIVTLLSVGVIFESVLTIAQWFNQGSIFGYWFFGENRYTAATPGIAILDLAGIRKVRPYGTFPHPNVLGGYLAISVPWIFYEIISQARKAKREGQNCSAKLKTFYMVTFIWGTVSLYLSFSRSAWFVGALGLLLTSGLSWRRGLASFLLAPFSSLLTTLSVVRRAELNWIALQMIKDNPLLGVGLNNFTVMMDEYGRISGWARFLQPVHNIYLLIASEIGLLGLLIFLGLLVFAFDLLLKNRKFLLLISLTQIVLLGLADHYLWTIQQGSLLFWFILGLVFSRSLLVIPGWFFIPLQPLTFAV